MERTYSGDHLLRSTGGAAKADDDSRSAAAVAVETPRRTARPKWGYDISSSNGANAGWLGPRFHPQEEPSFSTRLQLFDGCRCGIACQSRWIVYYPDRLRYDWSLG